MRVPRSGHERLTFTRRWNSTEDSWDFTAVISFIFKHVQQTIIKESQNTQDVSCFSTETALECELFLISVTYSPTFLFSLKSETTRNLERRQLSFDILLKYHMSTYVTLFLGHRDHNQLVLVFLCLDRLTIPAFLPTPALSFLLDFFTTFFCWERRSYQLDRNYNFKNLYVTDGIGFEERLPHTLPSIWKWHKRGIPHPLLEKKKKRKEGGHLADIS